MKLPDDNPQCYPGSSPTIQEMEPVCPLPFLIPDSDSYGEGAYIYWLQGTACAFPCATPILYEPSHFVNQKKLFAALFTVACVCSLLLLINSIMIERYRIATMAAFTFNGAFWMALFVNLNMNSEFTCLGNAGIQQYNTFCVFCGFMMTHIPYYYYYYCL